MRMKYIGKYYVQFGSLRRGFICISFHKQYPLFWFNSYTERNFYLNIMFMKISCTIFLRRRWK